MPQQPKYLSTDPNAGAEAPAAPAGRVYLSTDPNAGQDAAPDPIKPDGTETMAAGAGLGLLAGAVPVARALAERVATSPAISATVGQAARLGGLYSLGSAANDVVHGRNPLPSLLKNEGTRQGVKLAYRAATPAAEGLGAEGVAGMAAPLAVPLAGGLAGLAGSVAFLGALEHDANRHVDIDYSKDTPDTAIARVFSNMRDSEKNRGRSLAERQDDPNDVMFRPDDSVTVTPDTSGLSRAAVIAQLKGGQR